MMLFYNANNHLRAKNTANKFPAQPTQILNPVAKFNINSPYTPFFSKPFVLEERIIFIIVHNTSKSLFLMEVFVLLLCL